MNRVPRRGKRSISLPGKKEENLCIKWKWPVELMGEEEDG